MKMGDGGGDVGKNGDEFGGRETRGAVKELGKSSAVN